MSSQDVINWFLNIDTRYIAIGALIVITLVIIKFVLSSLKWIFVIGILALIGWMAYGQISNKEKVGDVGRSLNPDTLQEETKKSVIPQIFDSLLDTEKVRDDHIEELQGDL